MTEKALLPLDEHNLRLQQSVHPTDWENPEPKERYNLVVIGAGTAGLVTASAAAGLGAKVALVERSLMGGDCLNVGCVPSKGIIRSARQVAAVKVAKNFGVNVPLGQARFVDDQTVEVEGAKLNLSRAVICTGARASAPEVSGLDQVDYLTNETLFSLTELPKRFGVVGAGPVGCEMAQTFARLGSDVTLITSKRGVLPKEDPDAAALVKAAMEKDGVRIIEGGKQLTVSKADQGINLNIGDQDIQVDQLLIAAGCAPNVEGLNLECVGVDVSKGGVVVNDRLQTTNKKIFAAGDVCSSYQFTHAADFMARNVISNALFFGRAKTSDLIIPWSTYISPEVAQVGITPQQAEAEGIEIDTFTQDMTHVDRAILDGETEGFVRVHVKKGSDQILGATVVAGNAGDFISFYSMAMKNKIGLKGIGGTIFPYPTQADAVRKTGDLYNRTRLTPKVKSLMDKFLAWRLNH